MDIVRCKTMDEFFSLVTEQVVKYGKENLIPISKTRELVLGFGSPDGEFLFGVNKIRGLLPDGEWRENTQLTEAYYRFGGQTPFTAVTRRRPDAELIVEYTRRVWEAIDKGEQIRAENHKKD